jgi:hypothetical protein
MTAFGITIASLDDAHGRKADVGVSPRPSRGTAWVTRSFFQILLHQAEGISTDCSCDRDELDDVDPPLTAFNFRDEGLRLTELVCELLLNHPGILPSPYEKP